MRRKKVWIIVLCAVLGTLLIVGALFAILRFTFPALYYRVYPFDRITGTVMVTVDGEPYHLHPDSFFVDKDADRSAPHVSIGTDGTARVSIHAGKYGMYGFRLSVSDVPHPIYIGAYQFNWWNVISFDLSVSIDTTANTVTFRSATREIHNDGSPYAYERTETIPLSDPEISFSVVNG